jgi:EAL domain-containing protein (putative c-di-GMP-specific phosphodiesterase class I)
MRAPFVLAGQEATVHASIGIASGSAGATADELLTQADVAMYSAKTGGKCRYALYEPHMHARIVGRHELAAHLERALERDEIRVDFQPIVSLDSQRTVAYEALVRWVHPTRGVLLPMTFLPLAEERNLMPHLGARVLSEACRRAAGWRAAYGDSLAVSVNLSPPELHAHGIADQVAAALTQSGLPPEALILEITEGGAMSDPVTALGAMHSLRRLGVRLALDDFGTGHASLGHLRDFPLDILKIAKPFVDRLERGRDDVTFLDAILQLATTLELTVVAEGIERPQQVDILRRLNCALGQGFYFSRPLTADVLEADLAERSAQQRRRGMRVA